MLPANSNRREIAAAIDRYMAGLPEQRELPAEIEIIIKYKEGTERHKIAL